jgi:HSP20 family molecular chaperone IbpA
MVAGLLTEDRTACARCTIFSDGGPRRRAVAVTWLLARVMLRALHEKEITMALLLSDHAQTQFMPAFELKETTDAFLVRADVPGMKETDLDVSLAGDQLIVCGRRESERTEQGATIYTWERDFGSFFRSFTLPGGIDLDHVRAELRDGVLTVRAPKRVIHHS